LAAALFRESLMAADWLRCYGFRPPPNSPVSAPVIHANRANDVAQLVSELDGTPTQLASTTFKIIDGDALDSIARYSHVWHVGHVLNQCPRRLTMFNDLHCQTQQPSGFDDARMIRVHPLTVRHRKPLAWRPGNYAIDATRWRPMPAFHVAPVNHVRPAHDTDSKFFKCDVK
jgi:hypothetical protein